MSKAGAMPVAAVLPAFSNSCLFRVWFLESGGSKSWGPKSRASFSFHSDGICASLSGSSIAVASPNAAASLTTFWAMVASTSGGAGGATPINSSSLAMRYPSSLRLPIISSAASRTAGRVGIAPNCHVRWSVRFPGLDRKFSNDGRSISSISPGLR